MSFAGNLEEVKVVKVHPAIGVARLTTNKAVFVYGEGRETYKEDGLMMRQAVQFRLFAYDASNEELGELDAEALRRLGLSVEWSAQVANRKLTYKNGDGKKNLIQASASSADGASSWAIWPNMMMSSQTSMISRWERSRITDCLSLQSRMYFPKKSYPVFRTLRTYMRCMATVAPTTRRTALSWRP